MRRVLAIASCVVLAAACTSGGSPTPTGGGGAPSQGTPSGGPGASSGAAFDPSTISGSVTLGQWDSSPAEHSALASALAAFSVTYPNIKVTQTTVSGDYRAQMVTKFGAHQPPDLFYVNAEYAQDWIDQGFLQPLDDYISKQGFDTSKFVKNYLDIYTGSDGKVYGLPKDANTIALAYNTDLVPNPPTTMDELVSVAQGLKGKSGLKAPMCLSEGLDRALAFLYAQGGSLISDDGKTETLDTPQSKQAVQWYLDLFKNGLGAPPPANSWCGEQLGKGNVAMVFEGGWLLGFMQQTYPKVNWKFAEMPTGSSGQKVTISYTAAYGIGVDSANKDQAWVLMQYLTGPQGMAVWTGGGIAVPSRSDVPVPAGFDIIVKGAAYSKPGSGFMRNYSGTGSVQDTFQSAFTKEVTNGTYSADAVVSATVPAINQGLNQ
jgi:multiple sugar transport system substrate-binding protein